MAMLGKYQLYEPLGRGAFGTVYRAQDTDLHVMRAVKILHPTLVADPAFISRFQYEAKLAASLRHANIIPVYDFNEDQGRFFLAMEYCPGGSLKTLIEQHGYLTLDKALPILYQVASGLKYAHSQDVVHRDLKPSNILFDYEGCARLADFGFARVIVPGSASYSSMSGLVGTPAYMPPEVWDGKPATPATDIYSLACILYEMLTGRLLFGGETPSAIMRRHFEPLSIPRDLPPGLPVGFESWLQRALSKEPRERIQNTDEFITELNALIKGNSPPSTIRPTVRKPEQPASQPQQTAVKPAKNRLLVGGLVAGLLVVLLGLGAFAGGRISSRLAQGEPTAQLVESGPVDTQEQEIQQPENPAGTFEEMQPVEPPSENPAPEGGEGALVPVLALTNSLPPWVKDEKGVVMTYISPGPFLMGSEDNRFERPVHGVILSGYYMDQAEATNAQYQECVAAGACTPPVSNQFFNQSGYFGNPIYSEYPVVFLSWEMANEYCEWRGARLPTEAEWEKAAHGAMEGMKFPWGDEAPACLTDVPNGAKFYDEESCKDGIPAKVGSYAANQFGLFDMLGNAAEWTADWFDENYYQVSPDADPLGPENGVERVLRGGSFQDYRTTLSVTLRRWAYPGSNNNATGVRCARSAEGFESYTPIANPGFVQQAVATAEPSAVEQIATVDVHSVNIRTGPLDKYPVMRVALRDEELQVIGRDPSAKWLAVAVNENWGGWVIAYPMAIDTDIAQLPVIQPPPLSKAQETSGSGGSGYYYEGSNDGEVHGQGYWFWH